MNRKLYITELYQRDAERLALYLSQRDGEEISLDFGDSEYFPQPPKGLFMPREVNSFVVGDYHVAYILDGEADGKDIKYHNRNLHRIMLGERIKDARLVKGITLVELERLTGIKARNIENIESGRLDAGIDVISNIGEALGCHLDFIFDDY